MVLLINIIHLAGIWLGKDNADHDILAVGNQRLVRCRAIRQTDKMWDKERLAGLAIGPSDLLKLATHSKVKLLPAVPPMPRPVQNQGEVEGDVTADEAASDPPSPEEVPGGEADECGEMATTEEGESGEELPRFCPEADLEQPRLKRSIEGEEGRVESKALRAEPREKHAASDMKEKEQKKYPRIDLSNAGDAHPTSSSLQASPMNAGNIRRISTYRGVDVYVEDEDDSAVDQYFRRFAFMDGYFWKRKHLKMRRMVHQRLMR